MAVLRTHKYTAILCLTLAALHACAPVLLAQNNRVKSTNPRLVKTTPAVQFLEKADYTVKIAYFREQIAATSMPGKKTGLKMELASYMGKAAISQNKPVMLVESGLIYEEVIASSWGETRLKASNNYCAQLLRSKRAGEAVVVMKNVERTFKSQSIDRKMESRFLYNYGKALQMTKNYDDAYKVFQESMKADPRFKEAARAAAQIALNVRSESIGLPQMLELIDKQLSLFDYEGAGRNLHDAFVVEHWANHKLCPRLFVQLVRYLTVADLDLGTFQKRWVPLMDWIERSNGIDKNEGKMAQQIVTIYAGHLKVNLNPDNVAFTFRCWRPSDNDADNNRATEALSEFMKATGDRFQDQDALDKTLACYSNAWALNVENMEAGLYVANVLYHDMDKGGRKLDPQGRWLNQFIDQLFLAKNREYRRSLGQDWDRILKCHIILASIFEKQGSWGSLSNPRSAVFQWNYAQKALLKVSPETQKRFGPVVERGVKRAANRG